MDSPSLSRVNTPGVAGYATVVVATAVVYAAGIAVAYAGDLGAKSLDDFLVLAFLAALYAAILVIPLATVGLVAVHLVCRGARSQLVHVVATGVVASVLCLGTLIGLALVAVVAHPPAQRPELHDAWTSSGDEWFLVALAAVAGATARALVIPLVWSRRAQSSAPESAVTAR